MARLFRRLKTENRKTREAETSASTASTGSANQVTGVGASVRVITDFGPVPAMLLRAYDKLRCADGELTVVQSVRMVAFDQSLVAAMPEVGAIRIEAEALGSGLPRTDLMVAPRQPIRGDGQRTGSEFLAAEDCLHLPGVSRAGAEETTYYVITCDRQAEIMAEGVPLRV